MLGLVVAILAFGLLQTVVDAWYAGAESAASEPARHAQRDLARVPAAAALPREDPRGRRASRGGARRTGSAASTRTRRTSSRSSRSTRCPTSRCTRSTASPTDELQRVPARPQGRDRRAQARRAPTASRSATRFRSSGTIYPGHLGVHACAAIYDGADAKTDDVADSSSTGTTSTRRSSSAPAPRRPGGRVRGADRGSRQRSAEIAQAIDAPVQELARGDADRDREGVPARLRRDDRGDRGRDPASSRSSSSSSSWR